MASKTTLAFISNLIYRLVNVVIFILISRYLGSEHAGMFSLGLTYLLFFTTLSLGLDDFLTKVTLSGAYSYGSILINFLSIKLILSIIFFLLTIISTNYLFTYNDLSRNVIVTFCISIFFESAIMLFQVFYYAFDRYALPFFVFFAIGIFRLILSYLVISLEKPFIFFGLIWFVTSLLGFLFFIISFFCSQFQGNSQKLRKILIKEIILNSKPFFSLSLLNTIEYQLDIIILSYFRSTLEVGFYSAITTVFSFSNLLGQAFRAAIYPKMVRLANISQKYLVSFFETSRKLMFIISAPIAVGGFLLSSPIIKLIFGEDFTPSAYGLQIIIWATIFQYLNIPNTRFLLAKSNQSFLVRFLFVSAISNFVCNVILVPFLGIFGAAISRVISSFAYWLLSYLYISRNAIMDFFIKSIWRIIPITLCMGITCYLFFYLFHFPLIITILCCSMIYFLLIFKYEIITEKEINFLLNIN